MALQGTLETFSVPEVLRLLSGTKKTGLLALEGDRGAGHVWLDDGRIAAASSDHEQGDRLEAVLFDLLRFDCGSFAFESGSRPDETVHDADVETVLAEAEQLLDEWRAIESVVPSLDVHVQLVGELDVESVTVTAEQWKTLAVVAGGISARSLGADLGLGEFDTCSLLRDLVEAGLVTADETVDTSVAPAADVEERAEQGAHELASDDDSIHDDETSFDEMSFDVDLVDEEPEAADEAGTDTDVAVDEVGEPVDEPALVTDTESTPDTPSTPDPEDFLSQLSSLSPKAAAAIEATAERDDDEPAEHDAPAASDAVGAEGDEEINRNLLLKFLSSAKN